MVFRKDISVWAIFARVVTACFCNACLRNKDKNTRQAWREKVTLCLIILFVSATMAFVSLGMSGLACPKNVSLYPQDIMRLYGPQSNGTKVHLVRGKLYNTGAFFSSGSHRPIAPFSDDMLKGIISPLFGRDISDYFPPDYSADKCQVTPKDNGPICSGAVASGDKRNHCHTSPASRLALEALSMNQFVAFSWDNVTRPGSKMFVYRGKVYDLTSYLSPQNKDFWLGDAKVTEWLQGLTGRDATKEIARSANTTQLANCFERYMVGQIDGANVGCLTSNVILLIITVLFTGMTFTKFLAALSFNWLFSWKLGKISEKPKTKDQIAHILLLVTCYSEGVDSIRTSLNSLAGTDYSDEHKLLFVIADGDVTGSENDKSTPQICIDLLEQQFPDADEPVPMSYHAVGDGNKRHNMAKVYTGFYSFKEHRVPMCLIVKCGTPEEKKGPKPGNRGKRDSQLILMQWLSHICVNGRMTPLEFDLFEKVRKLTGITPDHYEMVLMVDADTMVKPDSVSHMVAAMERDPQVMGLCGETKVANKTDTWVTMIQVFEYFLNHHLGKAFESMFGGVTCLPGCFCMYRIKVAKEGGYSVPLLANHRVIEMYSSNTVETLHQKNLLLLGEDRYLTALMLKTFPRRKLIYVPMAICKTVVPETFSVLLSQRRRWINSTIHSLMELILVPQLCGIFCCSMQFLIFLELISTVLLPSSLLFLTYLAISLGLGSAVPSTLLVMAATYLLQISLVLFTTHKPIYIAWMFIFILAMPVWNAILPLYAFWHFDDFSWGATRKTAGEDGGHGGGGGDDFDPEDIPAKKWEEWFLENQVKNSADYELPAAPSPVMDKQEAVHEESSPPSPSMTPEPRPLRRSRVSDLESQIL